MIDEARTAFVACAVVAGVLLVLIGAGLARERALPTGEDRALGVLWMAVGVALLSMAACEVAQ